MKNHPKLLTWVSLLIWLVVLVAFWEIIASICDSKFNHPENYIPHIHQIIASFFDSSVKISGKAAIITVFKAAGSTLLRALYGFLLGTLIGFILALLMDLCKVIEKIAFPYLMIIQMVPIIGMAPIVFAIAGDVGKACTIIAAILTFYPVTTNVMAGFKSVEAEKYDLMKICSANKFQIYWHTKIPSALPSLFTGLKIAAPLAITASVLIDTLEGGTTLGGMISSSLSGKPSYFIFWQIVFICAVVGIGSSALMGLIEKFVCPYRYGRRSIRTIISIKLDEKKKKKEVDGYDKISEK